MIALLDSFSGIEEQRCVLPNIKWQQYESLLATLGDYRGLRLIYLEGTLEIFMPSPEHELLKKAIARLLERYAEELGIPLHGYGSTTFRREAMGRGLEPDECYCIGEFKEFPDFAVEINLTSGGVDKLAVYKGLGIPEVLILSKTSDVKPREASIFPVLASKTQSPPNAVFPVKLVDAATSAPVSVAIASIN